MSPDLIREARHGFARCGVPIDASVVVAVSGGADSMALLSLCRALVDDGALAGLSAIHVNHSVRPAAETEADYQLVRDYCVACDIRLHYAVIPPNEIATWQRGRAPVAPSVPSAPSPPAVPSASAPSPPAVPAATAPVAPVAPHKPHRDGGFEAAARQKRLRCYGELLRQRNLRYLCTAHHRDDNAETVLMRLFEGGGVNGLAGIPHTQEMRSGDYRYHIIRPLLQVAKHELHRWIDANSVPYRQDSSNADPAILRNALRRDIIPGIARYFPRYRRAMERIATQVSVWQAYIDDQHTQHLHWRRVGQCYQIEKRHFFSVHRALQFQSFYSVADCLGARRRLPHRFVRQCLTAFPVEYCGNRGAGHGIRCSTDATYLFMATE